MFLFLLFNIIGKMKKRLLSLITFFLFVFSAHAQFRAGLSVCGVSTDVQGADFVDYDNDFFKIGFAAGGIMNFSNPDDDNSFQLFLEFLGKQ